MGPCVKSTVTFSPYLGLEGWFFRKVSCSGAVTSNPYSLDQNTNRMASSWTVFAWAAVCTRNKFYDQFMPVLLYFYRLTKPCAVFSASDCSSPNCLFVCLVRLFSVIKCCLFLIYCLLYCFLDLTCRLDWIAELGWSFWWLGLREQWYVNVLCPHFVYLKLVDTQPISWHL